jgi:hypothetical protein
MTSEKWPFIKTGPQTKQQIGRDEAGFFDFAGAQINQPNFNSSGAWQAFGPWEQAHGASFFPGVFDLRSQVRVRVCVCVSRHSFIAYYTHQADLPMCRSAFVLRVAAVQDQSQLHRGNGPLCGIRARCNRSARDRPLPLTTAGPELSVHGLLRCVTCSVMSLRVNDIHSMFVTVVRLHL